MTVLAEKEDKGVLVVQSGVPIQSDISYVPMSLKNERGQWLCGSLQQDGETICLSPFTMANGRCRKHGGGTPAGPMSPHLMKNKDIAERVEQLKGDGKVLDITSNIALTTALLERAIDKMEDIKSDLDGSETLEQAKVVSVISTNLTKMTEIKHKIDVGHFLSPELVRDQIQIAAAHIQRSCSGCDKLPQLAAQLQSMTSKP